MNRKTIFISYANEAMAYSLKRIGRQARRLGIFDDVILYTPADVPDYARKSPLFSCPRGAGYWCWKPALIHETLQRFEEGTVVVYVDAGCTLRKSSQWSEYLGRMEQIDMLCFQYAENQPQWEKWGSKSGKTKYWTKKSTLDFMDCIVGNQMYHEYGQIWGGCLFFKGKENPLLKEWLNLTFQHPELIMDPTPEELLDQGIGFAGHRHDQSILTPLCLNRDGIAILQETSEQYTKTSFVWASRIRACNLKEYIAIQTKHYLRLWLGDNLFDRMKHLINI